MYCGVIDIGGHFSNVLRRINDDDLEHHAGCRTGQHSRSCRDGSIYTGGKNHELEFTA
jgi:hypothetical protein